jgi:hypothetical protein
MFERIGPTFERKKSYVWAQKKIHDWAHFTLAIYYLPEKKKEIIIKIWAEENKSWFWTWNG